MDLLEYAAMQMKKGKKPAEIRQLLVQNGYPVYEVENALAVNETKEESKSKGSPFKVSVNIGNAPGYMIMIALSGILILVGTITLAFYFF